MKTKNTNRIKAMLLLVVVLAGVLFCSMAGCAANDEFSEKELADMQVVDEVIQRDIFGAEGYKDMTIEQRKELAEEVLVGLAKEGLIYRLSIHYDKKAEAFSFMYKTAGCLGCADLSNWNPMMN